MLITFNSMGYDYISKICFDFLKRIIPHTMLVLTRIMPLNVEYRVQAIAMKDTPIVPLATTSGFMVAKIEEQCMVFTHFSKMSLA